MPTDQRRAAGRRRAWGRGPIILRFEPLEDRQLLSTTTPPVTAPAALPDLVGQSFQTPTDLNWGGSFQAQGVVVNQGTAPAARPFQVDIYASPTPAVGAGAVLLGEATIAAGLKPGAQAAYSVPLTLPPAPVHGIDPSGAFYVAAVIDPQHAIQVVNTRHSADTGAGYDYTLVNPPVARTASLVGTGLSTSPSETDWGGTFSLTQQVTNLGTADAPETRALVVLTPSGSTPGGSSAVTIGSIRVPAIPAGQSATVSPSITLPPSAPSALKGASSFTLSVVQDADYVTDPFYPHSANQGAGADQTPITITTPSYAATAAATQAGLRVTGVAADSQSIKWGQSFQAGATLTNAGKVDPGSFVVRYLLVGGDGTIANALFLADTTVNGLAPGATTNVMTTLKLPAAPPAGATVNGPGLARIAVIIDPENTIDEPRTATAGVSDLIQLPVNPTPTQTTVVAAVTAQPAALKPTAVLTSKTTTTTTKTGSKIAKKAEPPITPKPAKAPKRKLTAKPTTHSLEHNLKVFPSRVSQYFKKTFHIK